NERMTPEYYVSREAARAPSPISALLPGNRLASSLGPRQREPHPRGGAVGGGSDVYYWNSEHDDNRNRCDQKWEKLVPSGHRELSSLAEKAFNSISLQEFTGRFGVCNDLMLVPHPALESFSRCCPMAPSETKNF